MTIEGDKFAPAAGYTPAKVTGRVKNGGTKAAELVRVLVAGYDAKGNLVAVDEGGPELDTIPAGQTSAFSIDLYQTVPDAKVAKVELLVVGNEK